eukprot:1749289-Amphidinium_carterae.4
MHKTSSPSAPSCMTKSNCLGSALTLASPRQKISPTTLGSIAGNGCSGSSSGSFDSQSDVAANLWAKDGLFVSDPIIMPATRARLKEVKPNQGLPDLLQIDSLPTHSLLSIHGGP